MNNVRSYIKTINIAKGIGIILVVIGHYQPPGAPLYFSTLVKAVYTFHMPLFFVLSGYLFSSVDFQSYPGHLRKKVRRLLYPFISAAILFVIVKYASGLFFNLYHPITLNEIKEFFICPINSFAPMLWFVQVLIIIFAIYPLVDNLINNKALIFVVSVILYSISVPRIFCLNMVFQSMPYFTIGTILSTINFDRRVKKLKIVATAFLGVVLFMIIFFKSDFYDFTTYKYLASYRDLILGINGIVVCILLAVLLNQYSDSGISKCIEKVGYYSMSIYLFHTIFMNLPLIIIFQVFHIKNIIFEFQASIAIISGVVITLLVEKHILRKNNITRKFLLGLP